MDRPLRQRRLSRRTPRSSEPAAAPPEGATAGGPAARAAWMGATGQGVPPWALHLATAAGTALATAAIYAWGADSVYGPLPYALVTAFAFSLLPLRAALGQLALIAAAFALELALDSPGRAPVAGWAATVATLLAVGLVIASLRRRLGRDPGAAGRDRLTGLPDRRGFSEAFELELERARRAGAPLSLVVGDLDGLRRANEELGRAWGDDALTRVSDCIRSAKRSFDTAARVGGEEFALLAPDCDEHGAYLLAERVRASLERGFGDGPVALTMSFGVATFPLHGRSAEALLRAADQALYAAKRLGGNRTVISSAEVPGILARAPRGQDGEQLELTALLQLAEALDVRDSGSASHCQRVGRFAELMARELGLPPEAVERVRLAGVLHDVGRVGMPDALLRKPGPLSDDDWAWVRSHPEVGARLLETTDFDDIRAWVLNHHERPDGRGYPEGVAWDDVPLEARIIAVADAYEAMTSDRPYRPALGSDEAAEELRRKAGRQFDERVVEALLRVV